MRQETIKRRILLFTAALLFSVLAAVVGQAQVTSTAPTNMVLIPAGAFTMGDTLDGESDAIPISVTVSAFYMDTNLVSYTQWQSVYSYATSHGYSIYAAASGKAANHPVQMVSWYDVVKWSNARSQQSGLTPVYYTDAGLTQVYRSGDTDAVYPNWAASGYRLPTEAEWEKAARGGLSGLRFPWGDTISWSQANYYGDPLSSNNPDGYAYDLATGYAFNPAFYDGDFPDTSPVGYFATNGYGLYDMAGNVEEWCWDWYGTPYGQPTTTNPTGPASGGNRVVRGGAWINLASFARCANRDVYFLPYEDDPSLGFRCVRGLPPIPHVTFHRLVSSAPPSPTFGDLIFSSKDNIDAPLGVTNDENVLGAWSGPASLVQGLVADGVTPLLLRVSLPTMPSSPLEYHISFNVNGNGSLRDLETNLYVLGTSGWTPTTNLTLSTSSGYAYLSGLRAEDLDSAFDATNELTVQVGFTVAGSTMPLTNATFRIRRPPVVLVHGYASDSSTWSASFLNTLAINVPSDFILPINYGVINTVQSWFLDVFGGWIGWNWSALGDDTRRNVSSIVGFGTELESDPNRV